MEDREPLEFDGRWLWHNADHPLNTDSDGGPADHLPGDVFDLLTGHMSKPERVTKLVKAYPTYEAAMLALYAALPEET